MDYDKLICQLLDFKVKIDGERLTPLVCLDAATAIETQQIENQALRNAANGFKPENEQLHADLARVTAERDGAEKEITRLKAIMREKGIFTIPAKYPLEKPEWNW